MRQRFLGTGARIQRRQAETKPVKRKHLADNDDDLVVDVVKKQSTAQRTAAPKGLTIKDDDPVSQKQLSTKRNSNDRILGSSSSSSNCKPEAARKSQAARNSETPLEFVVRGMTTYSPIRLCLKGF